MTYKFDLDVLVHVCNEVVDLPLDNGERLTALIEKLAAAYPDFIDDRPPRWTGTKAGGILGKISFLYLGFSEYLLIFGSPAATDGFTGRYNYVDLYKVILAGQYVTYDLESDQIAATVYRPGDLSWMERGRVRGLEIQAGSWHLEYGRGRTFTTVPFGVVDTLISSLEVRPLLMAGREFAAFIAKDLRRRAQGRS